MGKTRTNWIGRKIHLYNVTMGLYMLDFWEQCLFNLLMLVLLWFIFYNTTRSASEFYKSYLKSKSTATVFGKFEL